MKNEVTSLKNHVDKVTGSIGNSFKSIRNIVAGLGIASLIKSTILGNVDAAIKRVDTLSNYSRVMSNLSVGSVQANASIQKLSNKLIGLPTTLDDASGAVQRFTSVNGNISRSTDMFLALNNAILAGGASSEIQKSALEQLSQSYAKGKPDMFEWRSAMTAMPAQMKQVAEAMGFVNASALGEALRNGTVSMDQFMNTLMQLNTQGINGYQSFEEQARNATGGIATSIANMRTAIVRCMSEVMNTIGQSNIAGFFTNIAKAINSCVPYVVAFTKVIMVAVGYLTALFGGKSKKLSSSFGGVSNNAKKAAGNTGALAKKMSDASDSSQKLSKGASGTGSGLKKAAGNASKLKKELKGALAGFDAINNINSSNGSSDPSSGDSGGSGGAGGSGGDIGGFSMDDSGAKEQKGLLEEVDKQLEEIKKKVAEFFQPLKQSWDKFGAPMIAAAVYAFNGVKNLLMEIGKSMYTVWENGTGAPVTNNVPNPKPSETPPKPSSYDQWVADLQEELNRQYNMGLVVDGLKGPKTLAACPLVRKGARGNITRLIQRRLNSVGFHLSTDGIFGSGTYNAVNVFQKNRGLYQDGKVGKKTWDWLLKGTKM